MKIISHKGLRIVYDNDKYSIKTPIGVFKDINDAIEVYPILTEVDRVKECKYCGKYFLRTGVKDVRRVYCSDDCYKKSDSERRLADYYGKIFVKTEPFKPDHYLQKIRDHENRDFNKDKSKLFIQDDNYWGLGTGNLTGTPANSFDKEKKYIRNELKRLGIR